MTYDKVNWTETTPLDAANLDQMDVGIDQAHTEIGSHTEDSGDSAHAHMARIVSGTYTGNGSTTRTISTPFTPALVYVSRRGDGSNAFSAAGRVGSGDVGLLFFGDTNDAADTQTTRTEGSFVRPELVSGGFRPRGIGSSGLNQSGGTYDYVAIG